MEKSTDPPTTPPKTGASAKPVKHTPVKHGTTQYLPDTGELLDERLRSLLLRKSDVKMDPNFIETHFSDLSDLTDEEKAIATNLASIVTSQEGHESKLYGPVSRLLSYLSSVVKVSEGEWCDCLPPGHRWLWLNTATIELKYDRAQPKIKPDVASRAATMQEIHQYVYNYNEDSKPLLPEFWSQLGGAVELKRTAGFPNKFGPDNLLDIAQSCGQQWAIARAKPQQAAFWGMHGHSKKFCMIYYGVSRISVSPVFAWSDVNVIYKFVECCHRREKLVEDSLFIQRTNPDLSSKLLIKFKNTEMETVTLVRRDGRRRKLLVSIVYSKYMSFLLKHSWRNPLRRFPEDTIINNLLKDGYILGLPILLPEFIAPPLVELKSKEDKSWYERFTLAMRTIGAPLSACKSIKQFLIVMFDLVELLRLIGFGHKVLHRDVSFGNIILEPRMFSGGAPTLAENQPVTYESICGKLGREYDYPGRDELALSSFGLIDFELSVDLSSTEDSQVEDGISGTPMFIAQDRSHRRRIIKYLPRGTDIIFSPTTTKAYTDLFPAEGNGKWEKFWNEINDKGLATKVDFVEGPLHDIESVFWVMFFFLIRATPGSTEGRKDEAIPARSAAFRGLMQNDLGGNWDPRSVGIPSLIDALHPELQHLGPMLAQMSDYFQTTWHLFDVPPSFQMHAHEFMRRLLFKELYNMKDDIPLTGDPSIVKLPESLFSHSINSAELWTSKFRTLARSTITLDDSNTDTIEQRPNKRQKIEGFPGIDREMEARLNNVLETTGVTELWFRADKIKD